MLLALLFALARPALALDPPKSPDDGPAVKLSATFLDPRLPMTPELRTALAERDHAAAATGLTAMDKSKLSGEQVADQAFLLAWSYLRAERPKDAIPLLQMVQASEDAPPDYKALTVAEILYADGKNVEAAAALAAIPATSRLYPRAQLVRARALRDAGNTAEARAVYEALAARPDPAEGSDYAIQSLAMLAGEGSPEANALYRRLWAWYPSTGPGQDAAKKLTGKTPTLAESAIRGDILMMEGRYDASIAILAPLMTQIKTPSADACRLWYAYGRSLFRANRISDSATVLRQAGEGCKGIDEDRGAKSFYLAGKAEERKKAWGEAAIAYRRIAEYYPAHSYADDGLALAGIALQETGDLAGARALWADQVKRYPTGDLAAEGFWRLAWGAYLAGDTPAAIGWAEQSVWEVPYENDPVHVQAALYWAARWRAYPDLADPTKRADPAKVAEAVRLFSRFCEQHPWSYYGILASSRLRELDPAAAAKIPRPAKAEAKPWVVRQAFLNDPASSAALALTRLGLYRDALAEFQRIDDESFTPAEFAVMISIRWANDDWLMAHDQLRQYLEHHPPENLGEQRDHILLLAYPDKYWTEVQTAAKGYSYDPRLFHGLVREESNFNKDIVSHAGAKGLSQLMPATAKMVAGWMGIKVSTSQLTDPLTNLRIGSRYLESLVTRYKGNTALALAGYNAGEGNVANWLNKNGNGPTDAWVEGISFRETRGYVKRVSRTWQTYHVLYDGGETFPDLSAFNHKAVP